MRPTTKLMVCVIVAAWALLFVWGVFLFLDRGVVKSKWKPSYDLADEIERPSGEDYVLYDYNGETFFVTRSENWAMTQAAKTCYLAKKEHESLVLKYQQSPAGAPPSVHALPDTVDTVVWAEKSGPKDIEYRGKKTYLFVQPHDTFDRDTVLQRLAMAMDPSSSELVRQQLINLRDNR